MTSTNNNNNNNWELNTLNLGGGRGEQKSFCLTCLHFAYGRTAHPVVISTVASAHFTIRVGAVTIFQHGRTIYYCSVFGRTRTATWMPYCSTCERVRERERNVNTLGPEVHRTLLYFSNARLTLKIHFFAVSERIPTFATSRTRRMKMMVVSGL